jgi:hypothetical protein
MATKTFKIGESCQGGVITAIATKTKVTIIGKQWDYSTGSNRNSDQSNAKEFTRLEVDPKDTYAFRKLDNFLCDLTTSYYTDKVIEWIETKVKLKEGLFR